MDKNAWKSIYTIVQAYDTETVEYKGFYINPHSYYYNIIDEHGHVHGTYKDAKYAVKQARYKYKKLVKLLERKLMS